MKKNVFVWIVLITVIIFVAYLFKVQVFHSRSSIPVALNGKISVVASFYPLAYFAERIGGDYTEVTTITPAGAEPHDYEPTAQEIIAIQKSTLLLLNGGGLEAWGNSVKSNLTGSNVDIVTVSEDLATQQTVEGGGKSIDPHVWLSPVLAQHMIDNILAGYIAVDPAHADIYRTNAHTVQERLQELDQMYRQGLADCSLRDFITSHAAFGYLASTYGLHQVAIAGLSPDAEPSAKQLADITTFVKEHKIRYIFFESLVSPKLAETLAQETGAQTLVLNPLEGLTEHEIASGDDYFTVMKDNLANIRIALQCK